MYVASYDEARKKIDKAVKGDDLSTTDAETRKKTRKSRMAKSVQENYEDTQVSKKRSRIRQYPVESSSNEDEMQKTPAPPAPPPIALANATLPLSCSNKRARHSLSSKQQSTHMEDPKPNVNTGDCLKNKKAGQVAKESDIEVMAETSSFLSSETSQKDMNDSSARGVMVPSRGKIIKIVVM